MASEVELDKLHSHINSQNVFPADASLVGRHALPEDGVEPEYAVKLFSGLGWNVYTSWLASLRFLALLCNHTTQIQTVGSAFKRQPFSEPDC